MQPAKPGVLGFVSRIANSRRKMRAGLALGSNLEPRLFHLQAAHREISKLHSGTQPIICSRVYETSPVDCPPGSPSFLNAAVEIFTNKEPHDLIHELKGIEEALGRTLANERNTPRPIDIDLLYYGNIVLSTPTLTIPHPRIASRRFVLQPLADICPGLILPTLTKSIEELLEELNNDESVRLYYS
ncbi:MAG TPA: 2-amino-4-hydroxy-6-hydroxymethyldihydropteridine diphosphokinase [Terrimicrobiaceae bacterium]